MNEEQDILDWIDTQADQMSALARKWTDINSHSLNLAGLKILSEEIVKSLAVFGEEVESIEIPPYETINAKGEAEKVALAPLLTISKRPQAKKKVLLVCHMDTVFAKDDPFQKTICEKDRLKGPGVIDPKAGIVIMLKALEALERSSAFKEIGWRVVINTDEEIGSPGSGEQLKNWAKEFDIGLVFEPCLPDGNLVGARKGSGNFTLVAKGIAAHAGREPEKGRNAIEALARCILSLSGLNQTREGLTVNVGVIEGGQARNIVPALAILQFNIRIQNKEDQIFVEEELNKIVQQVTEETGVELLLHGKFFALPKELDEKTLKLFARVKSCAADLGMDLKWQDSGGVCDGNRLAEAGLPTVDTMGARGGHIHSREEYLNVNSLVERTKLTALSLMRKKL